MRFSKCNGFVICFLILFLCSCQFTNGLKCKCDICKNTNYTCETDGYCFTSTTLEHNGEQVKRYRCLDGNLMIPENNPVFCHPAKNFNHTFVMECCKDGDLCNEHLHPKLHPRPTDAMTRRRSLSNPCFATRRSGKLDTLK